MKCKLCNKQTTSLEVHHIIPRVKGGTDDENNLIKICIDCHGKIHNVDFSKKEGLISLGLQKAQKENIEALEWINNNSKKIENKMNNLIKYDTDLANFISYLMYYEFINSKNIKDLVLNNQTKIKITKILNI